MSDLCIFCNISRRKIFLQELDSKNAFLFDHSDPRMTQNHHKNDKNAKCSNFQRFLENFCQLFDRIRGYEC